MKGQVKNIFFIEADFAQGLPIYEMIDGTLKIPMKYPDPQFTKNIMTCWVGYDEVGEGLKQDIEKKKILQAMFQLAKLQVDKIKIALRNAKFKVVN